MVKKTLVIGLLLINLGLCSGCGFHARSVTDLPPSLKKISLEMPNIDAGFQTDVNRFLESLQITIDPNASLVLNISAFNITHNDPGFTTTTQAVTYIYTMTLTFSILKNNKVLIPPRTLSASRAVIMNVNQIYTSNTASLAKTELERELINLLYTQLISQNTHTALKKT